MGIENELSTNPKWYNALIVCALLLGGGGSTLGILQDTEKYHTDSEAEAEFALRDERNATLRKEFEKEDHALQAQILRLEARVHELSEDAHDDRRGIDANTAHRMREHHSN